jgi:hypothetical protein
MVSVMAQALDDVLVDNLQYKLGEGASYVDRRESCTFFPQGSNVYSPSSGNKVLRIALNADGGFLDPSTVRFNFTLKNNGAVINNTATPPTQDYGKNRLRPLSGPWCFWRRMRVLCNQTVVEDFTDYNKVHEMIEQTQNRNVRDNDDICGFEWRWDNTPGVLTNGTIIGGPRPQTLTGIAAQTSRTCSFTPLSGLLGRSNKKYIPLKYGNIIFEMEIVGSEEDAVLKPDGTTFLADSTTTSFQIEDCQIKADIVYLHNEVANAYSKHLENGSIPIKYTTYYTISQSIVGAGNNVSVNVARSATRLKQVFASFYNNTSPKYWLKQFNSFLHPMINTTLSDGSGVSPCYDQNYELEWQIQIGGKFYPSYPVRSLAEAFTHYLKALNYPDKYQHSTVMDAVSWRSTKFFISYDFEKLRDASFTGIDTSSGDLMIIRCRASPLATNPPSGEANKSWIGDNMFVVLVADNILNISSVGTTIEG